MDKWTYEKTGVDISHTDALKREMSVFLDSPNPRVLNKLGPFASLYDIKFDDIEHPVLVMKSEEPGSKQKLAVEHGYVRSICHDMINHLVNDIIVMGAKPLAVLDTIVCGHAGADTIKSLIKGISEACRENECDLVGGETSVQPGVVDKGVYILTASIAGIADKKNIIDGSKIKHGDKILALASNGLHTNGYTLVRNLMEAVPQLQSEPVAGMTFLEAIMKPHTPYYKAVKELLGDCSVHGIAGAVHGLAHITGGGIEGNLPRIFPDGIGARIDLSSIVIPPVFKCIKEYGNIADDEMLRTFNCGAGFIIVADPDAGQTIIDKLSPFHNCYTIGEIIQSTTAVEFIEKLNWS